MNQNSSLYDKTGGGRAKYSTGWTVNATWPFSHLALYDDGIEYKLVNKRLELFYKDIAQIRISRLGYIWFDVRDQDVSYAFTGKGLDRIIDIFKSKNVSIPQEELKKLDFAKGFVKAEIVFVFTLFTIWLVCMLAGIVLILTHLIRV